MTNLSAALGAARSVDSSPRIALGMEVRSVWPSLRTKLLSSFSSACASVVEKLDSICPSDQALAENSVLTNAQRQGLLLNNPRQAEIVAATIKLSAFGAAFQSLTGAGVQVPKTTIVSVAKARLIAPDDPSARCWPGFSWATTEVHGSSGPVRGTRSGEGRRRR